jgi:hypothetical protein
MNTDRSDSPPNDFAVHDFAFFLRAGGQSHIFTYQVPSAVVYPLIGSWRLAGGFGLRETAHSRLKLGSARRSNPTLHSR